MFQNSAAARSQNYLARPGEFRNRMGTSRPHPGKGVATGGMFSPDA